MGSGASKRSTKSATKKTTAVVADVVIPGQPQPVKVRGHVSHHVDPSSADLAGGARLTEVAPSRYNVKIGNRDVGTFEVPSSDFADYLREAASITVCNIEAVNSDEEFTPPQQLHIPLARQSSVICAYNYSDDEDWEGVVESLDQSEAGTPESGRRKGEEARERRAKIKQAIREKREKLTQQEYQKMIANHKQEMELMAILREREKERYQVKLGSKVNERKRRREARLAERKSQDNLLAEKDNNQNIVTEPENGQAPSVSDKNGTKNQDKQNDEKEDIPSEPERNTPIGHKKSFLNKLAAAKSNKVVTITEVRKIEAELEEKQNELNILLKEKKPQLSDEDYKRVIAQHRAELGQIQERLEAQRGRQTQEMLDKLAARRKMKSRGQLDGSSLTADEVRELQLALNHRVMSFRGELKEARLHASSEECQEMIDRHRREMEDMQNQLDEERERMRRELMEKLNKRRRRSKENSSEEPCFTSEELKQLQLAVDSNNIAEKQRIGADKNRVSSVEYSRLMDRHQHEVEAMEAALNCEREVSRQRMEEKLAQRRHRNQRPESASMVTCVGEDSSAESVPSEEMQSLRQQIESAEQQFQDEVEGRRSEMTQEEYQRLLEQHRREMERLREKLKNSEEEQRRRMEDKLAARRLQRERRAENNESAPSEEMQSLQQQIDSAEQQFQDEVEGQRSEMTQEEYQRLLQQHKKEMERLQEKLKNSEEEQRRRLEEKLAKRRLMRERATEINQEHTPPTLEQGNLVTEQSVAGTAAGEGNIMSEAAAREVHEKVPDERLRLKSEADFIRVMATLDKYEEDDSCSLSEQELVDLTHDLKAYSQTVHESLDDKRGVFPDQELNLMISEHRQNMEVMASRLQNQRLRMEGRLAQKLKGRRSGGDREDYTRGVDDVKEARVLYQQGLISSDDDDEYEEEREVAELDDLSDIGVIVPQLATTQFWTTPIQSKDLLIVPLSDEYPVQKKSELYTDPSIFKDLDAHAIRENGVSARQEDVLEVKKDHGHSRHPQLDIQDNQSMDGEKLTHRRLHQDAEQFGDLGRIARIPERTNMGEEEGGIEEREQGTSGRVADEEDELHILGDDPSQSLSDYSGRDSDPEDFGLTADDDLMEYERAILAILEEEDEEEEGHDDYFSSVVEEVSEDAHLNKNNNLQMTDREIGALERDLEVYQLSVTTSLRQEWQMCRDEELDLLMMENCQNLSLMRLRIKEGKRQLKEGDEGECDGEDASGVTGKQQLMGKRAGEEVTDAVSDGVIEGVSGNDLEEEWNKEGFVQFGDLLGQGGDVVKVARLIHV